jgi:hypothetical protein
MSGDCPASLCHFLRVSPGGKHSAPRRTPFRYTTKLFAFPPESAFAFRPECCSESQRNGVRFQTGIAFAFDRISPILPDQAMFQAGLALSTVISLRSQ